MISKGRRSTKTNKTANTVAWMICCGIAAGCPGYVQAQGADNAPATLNAVAPDTASFDIRVDAPADLRDLLTRHMQLPRYRAVTDLDANELERLLLLAEDDVRQLLGTQGFFSPEIRISQSPASPGTTTRPVIVVAVQSGPATQVGAVRFDFKGDLATSTDLDAQAQRSAIEKDWPLPPGRRFTQAAWDEAKTRVTRQLLARRYPAGQVSYSLADVDAATHTADLQLQLDSGPLYRLGALKVSGLQRYDPVLVPRLARLAPGDIYDQRRLTEAQQRLTSSGYFDSAYVTVDPASDPAAAPVEVQLREARLQKIILGVGLTTDAGPRLSLEHIHNRVPGLDWRAQTKLQLEKKSPFAQTEWTSLPDEAYWRWVTSARFDRLDDGELVTQAQRLRFGRMQTGERYDRNFYLQWDRSQVSGSGTAGSTDTRTGEGSALSFNYAWTGRYFDSLPYPRSGYALGFEAGGGTTLGNDRQPFTRGVARWTGIVPLPIGRLSLRAEGGAIWANENATIPATQRFKTGGDTSVRGYGLREIGVPLASGATGPGRYLSTASAEWQRPILRNGLLTDWESTTFVDAGNVADTPQALRQNVAVGVGAGARWKSPIGPLQIDLAYGLRTRQLRLHMNVGWVF